MVIFWLKKRNQRCVCELAAAQMIWLMILMGQGVQGLSCYVYLDMCFYFCYFRWKVLSELHIHAVHLICSGSHYLLCQSKWLNLWNKVKWNCMYLSSKVHTRTRITSTTTLSHTVKPYNLDSYSQTSHNHYHQSITGTIKYVKYILHHDLDGSRCFHKETNTTCVKWHNSSQLNPHHPHCHYQINI